MFKRFICIGISAMILTACMNNPTTKPQEDNERVEQVSDNQNWQTNNEIATHLADVATNVPDVERAVSIVAGPYAVVAIDVDEKIDRQRVGTIKFSVNEALRDDPYGKTAIVVADADTGERIRNMRDRIEDGEPIIGIVDELADIVGRIMPTLPAEENVDRTKDREIDLNRVEPDEDDLPPEEN
ncbi:MAG TPA: YhcN/YlaJ family sporulation lipoprotein [Pseudogracilibacillus sp.]|nr:YhcN/YlaJ family sporulation lipoprotein [Pseudogracilibacillus sp.]